MAAERRDAVTPMKLAVFGASGRTGKHVVEQALALGHEVTAIVRDPAKLDLRDRALHVTTADVTDPEDVGLVLGGQDAAISTLGANGNKGAGIASAAVRAILTALPTTACDRLVAVSAVPVEPAGRGEPLLIRAVVTPLLRTALRDVYADLALMEEQLRRSDGVRWTVVRPPRLLNKPFTGRYRRRVGGNVRRATAISRADLACALLAVLGDTATMRQVVGVSR